MTIYQVLSLLLLVYFAAQFVCHVAACCALKRGTVYIWQMLVVAGAVANYAVSVYGIRWTW